MNHFLSDTLPLFGFGFIGIIVMAFIKMNDINKLNDTYTFGYVLGKFTQREWPSYGLAITIILLASLTHDEWLPIFTEKVQNEYKVGIGVKLFMALFGCLGQYFVYKKLGKMVKAPPPDKPLDEK